MWNVLMSTLVLRLLMSVAVLAAFALDSCMSHSCVAKSCDSKGARFVQDVYAVSFIALLVLTGLVVFWFYLASMDAPLSFSYAAGCEAAVNSTSEYDLRMRVCYGVDDPIANPSAALL